MGKTPCRKVSSKLRVPDTARLRFCSWPTALLISLLLCANATLGQSLSIKKVDANYLIEASAPADNPGVLQASQDLRLWVDIREDVQASYSFALDEAGVTGRYFRLIPKPPDPPPIRVMVIGDSMSADCCGWGGGLYSYFKPNATIVNYSQPWTSTKVFLHSAELDKMLLIKPDYVLIQFAWSDGGPGEDRGVPPPEFLENLRTIVNTIRGFDGTPILVTLHAARNWDPQGSLVYSDHPFNALTKQVAAELNTPLIDLYEITFALLTELGPSGSAFMRWEFGGPDDVMHLSPLGAVYVSRLLSHALPESLGPYLTRIFDQPPKP